MHSELRGRGEKTPIKIRHSLFHKNVMPIIVIIYLAEGENHTWHMGHNYKLWLWALAVLQLLFFSFPYMLVADSLLFIVYIP